MRIADFGLEMPLVQSAIQNPQSKIGASWTIRLGRAMIRGVKAPGSSDIHWGVPMPYMKTITLCFLLVLSGCVSSGATKLKPRIAQPAYPHSGDDSPVVFEGTVVERLESPGGSSGLGFAFYQGIRYHVDKVISGKVGWGDVVVFHILTGPPLTSPQIGALDPEIFKVGRKLRIRAGRTTDGEYVVADDSIKNVEILDDNVKRP